MCVYTHHRVWGAVSTASRIGALLSTVVLSAIMSTLGVSWRGIFFICASYAFVVSVVLIVFFKDHPTKAGFVPSPVDEFLADKRAAMQAIEDGVCACVSCFFPLP